jgi:hypothetical protein
MGHTHKHDRGHYYEHNHEEGSEMSKDEKTLRVLLVHWVNHNQVHQEDFKKWAEKAREMGKEEVADYIYKAIKYMQKANEMLMESKKYV